MKYLVMILSVLVLFSCSNVRSINSSKKSKSANTKTAAKIKSDNTKKADSTYQKLPKAKITKIDNSNRKDRFRDTTYIILNENNEVSSNSKFKDDFNSAVKLYDNEKFDEACEMFNNLLEAMPDDDPLFSELRYYIAECNISKNDFEPAKEILSELVNLTSIKDELLERVLVRLGQVFCVQGDSKNAKRLFDKLRKDFPKSIYLQLADCKAIPQNKSK